MVNIITGHPFAAARQIVTFCPAPLLRRPLTPLLKLETIAKSEEFSEMRFHQGDKTVLNTLNKKHGIKFPIKGKVKDVPDKVSLLIQAALGNVTLAELNAPKNTIMELPGVLKGATRIAKCMIEVYVHTQQVGALRSAVGVYQALNAKTWEGSGCVLRQVEGVGPILARQLASAGVATFDQLRATEPRQIEVIVGRNPPFGNRILDYLAQLPQLRMSVNHVREDLIVVVNGCNGLFSPLKIPHIGDPRTIELHVTLQVENKKIANARRGAPQIAFIASTSDYEMIDYMQYP